MDTPRPSSERVPLEDITNTTLRDEDPKERKRRRDRERYARMSAEKRSEKNKKQREKYKLNNQTHVDLDESMASHPTDENTTNKADENYDWLHRQTNHRNDLQHMPEDGLVPARSIGGTGDVDGIDTNELIVSDNENDFGHAPSSINPLLTSSKERKRERDKQRFAAMDSEQRALKNKRKRELNNAKKSAEVLLINPNETVRSSEGPGDIDENSSHRDINSVDETGSLNASNSIDNNIVMCSKERMRELNRARRATMSPEHKALLNKRWRELYAAKDPTRKAARKLQMTSQDKEVDKEVKRKEYNKKYFMSVREHRANNLHSDSLAMESPHFDPQSIFPSTPQLPKLPSHDMEIPKLTGTPVDIASTVVQHPEVQDPELSEAHIVYRHRVAAGERNELLSRRNRAFEANIGRTARGCADERCNDADNSTQLSVVCNETSLHPNNNCTSRQTQPSVVHATSSVPPNRARAHTPDCIIEDDCDADVIFEHDEEEDEAHFFAGQGISEKITNIKESED